jgi:ketosteroid isomerase-like protein
VATPENTQVVRDLYAAFGRGDLAAACALVAEDVVWHLPGTPHYSGTYKGPGGVAAFFQELNKAQYYCWNRSLRTSGICDGS